MAAVAPSPACVDAARLAAMVLGIESELSQAIAAANSTRANVLATRDSCRKSFAEYSATSAKLTVVKDMHWKLAVRGAAAPGGAWPQLAHLFAPSL